MVLKNAPTHVHILIVDSMLLEKEKSFCRLYEIMSNQYELKGFLFR